MGFRGGRSRILHCLGKPRMFFKDIPALGLRRNFLILRLIMLPVKYAFVKSKRKSKKKVVIIVNFNSLPSPHFFCVRYPPATQIHDHFPRTFPATETILFPIHPSSAQLGTLVLKSQLAKWVYFFSHLQNLQQFKLDFHSFWGF